MRSHALQPVKLTCSRISKRGMTIVEIVVAVVIAFAVLGFIAYLLWSSSRVVDIVFRQSIYQQSASLAQDKIADIVRNAKQKDFPTAPSSSVLYFKSKATPTVTSEISHDSSTKRLYYYPNKDNRSVRELLAKNIESATFTVTGEYMVRTIISFDYPRFTSILSGQPTAGMDGTIQTEIFPRPDNL
jgi:type II secretory pathway pseudopilin PulG